MPFVPDKKQSGFVPDAKPASKAPANDNRFRRVTREIAAATPADRPRIAVREVARLIPGKDVSPVKAGLLGAAGGVYDIIGAGTQLVTGGRYGNTASQFGKAFSEAGAEISGPSAFAGEMLTPVPGLAAANKVLGVTKAGLSVVQRLLRGSALGAATVPLVAPVENADEMSVGQFYSEKGMQSVLGALGGTGLVGVSAVGGAAAKKLIDILGNRTIRRARELISKYQGKTIEELEAAIKAEERVAAGAKAARGQAETGAATREARAQANAPVPLTPERQRVVATTRERERAAQAGLERAQREETAVADAVNDLRGRLATGAPQERQNFGGLIRDIAGRIRNTNQAVRVADAKFRQTLMESPAEAIVPTRRTQGMIEEWLKDINNPVEERVMRDLLQRLGPDATDSLNIRSVDSLKGYLNALLERKGEGQLDKALRKKVKDIKDTLLEDAYAAYDPYRVAMEAYRPASRPLDIVERKGALKPVLDIDPLSAQYRLTESEVVGEVIRRAQKGDQVFTRLLQENIAARGQKPELTDIRESARLYFVRELFERGQSPTASTFRTWLRQNEQMLRQLNIYDEFASLNQAQRTAQRAVSVARGAVEEAASLRRTAVGQAETAVRKAQKPEEIAAAATSRAEDAVKRLAKKETRATDVAGKLRDIQIEMQAARPEKIPEIARRGIKQLRDSGKLNDAQYKTALDELATIENAKNQAKQAENIRNWFYAMLIPLGIGGVLLRGGPATEPTPVGGR